MVLLSVESEAELERWEKELKEKGIRHAVFVEPDINWQKTALAVLPEDTSIFKKLRLF